MVMGDKSAFSVCSSEFGVLVYYAIYVLLLWLYVVVSTPISRAAVICILRSRLCVHSVENYLLHL